MDDQFGSIMDVIGTLGAYFTILMMLSLTVEAVLDAIKTNRWLNRKMASHEWLAFLDVGRKRVSPDQAMRDIAYWIPSKSQAELQIAALNHMAREFDVALEDFTRAADSMMGMTNDLIAMTGMTRHAAETRQQLAHKLYVLRQKFNELESDRITRLRRISAIVGVIIAFIFNLNSFRFLGPLFAPDVQQWLDNPLMMVGGTILTGLAASAGSSFWHDQLDRMRAVKESARSLQSVTAP